MNDILHELNIYTEEKAAVIAANSFIQIEGK